MALAAFGLFLLKTNYFRQMSNFGRNKTVTINVDIRYVLFIIDKYAGATNIIDELDIRKGEPKPLRVEEEKI